MWTTLPAVAVFDVVDAEYVKDDKPCFGASPHAYTLRHHCLGVYAWLLIRGVEGDVLATIPGII